MADIIQFRRGTAAQWAEVNPTLADGEVGLEKDTGKRKTGNGVADWNSLDYDLSPGGSWGDITGDIEDQTDLQDLLISKADLIDGKVPAVQLPSYVDDVLEFANLASFPNPGETGKIYVTLDTNLSYRWGGSAYIKISDVDITTKEDKWNKVEDLSNPNNTTYPTTEAVDTAIKLSDNANYIGHIFIGFADQISGKFADEETLRSNMYNNVGHQFGDVLIGYKAMADPYNTAKHNLLLTVKLKYFDGLYDTYDRSAERLARYTTLDLTNFFSGFTDIEYVEMDFHCEKQVNMFNGCTGLTSYTNTNVAILPYLPRVRRNYAYNLVNMYNTAPSTHVQSWVTLIDPMMQLATDADIATLFGSSTATFPDLTQLVAGYIADDLDAITGLQPATNVVSLTKKPYEVTIDPDTTIQGNTFNGTNQLVQLDGDGKLPAVDGSQLTGLKEEVIEANSISAFPDPGEQGKIYVALDTNKTYRWSGSAYVKVGGDDVKTVTFSTLTAMKAFTGTADVLICTQAKRGGTFYPYAGALLPDDGIVFQDTTSNKWIRAIGDHIDITWYDTEAGNKMNDVMDKITLYCKSSEALTNRVYVPQGTFNFTDTYVITFQVELYGNNQYRTAYVPSGSIFQFPQNVAGLNFQYINSGNSSVRDIKISGSSGNPDLTPPYYAKYNADAHGVIVNTVISMENVTVYNFSGAGLYVHAVTPSANANNSTFTGCSFNSNKGHGVDIQGADSNAMKFISCDFASNSGFGVYDKSFLGNHYFGCHFATNGSGSIPWGARNMCVAQDGKVYATQTVKGTVSGVEPTVTPGWEAFWFLTGYTPYPYWYIKPYSAVDTYIVSGNIFTNNSNQAGSIVGCYSENDQLAGDISPNMTLVGGNMILNSGVKLGGYGAVLNGPTMLFKISALGSVSKTGWIQGEVTGDANDTVKLKLISRNNSYGTIQTEVDNDGADVLTIGGTKVPRFYDARFESGFHIGSAGNNLIKFYQNQIMPGSLAEAALCMHHAGASGNFDWSGPAGAVLYKNGKWDRTNWAWARVIAASEHEVSTTTATKTIFLKLTPSATYVNDIDIDVLCAEKTASNSLALQLKVKFMSGKSGGPYVIMRNDTVEQYVSDGYEACAFTVELVSNYIQFSVTGIAGKTLNWLVRLNEKHIR